MKVLVIFDLIPENTHRTIVEMTESEYKFFSKAHNHYINFTEDEDAIDAANVISAAFDEDPEGLEFCDGDKQREYHNKWKSDLSVTRITSVDRMICSGFYL